MRTTLFLIGFCIMTNIASFGQDNKYLKSGVYEYRNISNIDTLSKHKNRIDADSTVLNIKPLIFWNFVSTRKLILKINEDSIVARYIINETTQF